MRALGGSVTGARIVSISPNSVLSVGGRLATLNLDFLAGGHRSQTFAVGGTIAGFAKADTIDLLGNQRA
jgi:hypothetical protein